MCIINSDDNKITCRYENADERNVHCNEMLNSDYTIIYIGGKGTPEDPLIATYIDHN